MVAPYCKEFDEGAHTLAVVKDLLCTTLNEIEQGNEERTSLPPAPKPESDTLFGFRAHHNNLHTLHNNLHTLKDGKLYERRALSLVGSARRFILGRVTPQ